MSVRRPAYLYHGSAVLLPRLEPRPGHGVGKATDALCAVYATASRQYAIPFAFRLLSDRTGRVKWSLEVENGKPRMVIYAGTVDFTAPGYVYRVPARTFERLDETQWISYEPVRPLDYEIVYPAAYRQWIVMAR